MTPSTDRAVPVPTARLALLITLAAVPVALLQFQSWVVVALIVAVVFGAGIVDGLLAVHPRQIDVDREVPAAVTVGDSTQVTWHVRNRADHSTAVVVADAIWPSLGASRHRSAFVLDAHGAHRFGARLTPSRRGRFPFALITVRTIGPLRLMARQSTRTVAGTMAVMPAYPSRDAMGARLRIHLESGIRSVRTRGTGTEFDQLREYRHGDDFRKIDWAASARQQHAVVRDYRSERNQHVIAMLDNGRVMAGTVGTTPRVEHAMDAVLGLTQVASNLGDNVGLLTFDSQVRGIVPARHSKAQFSRVAEAMYLLDPALEETAYRVAFTSAAARFRRRSLFVVFTDLVESVAEESLLPALRSLTNTHLVMVAAVRDPDVVRWASQAGHVVASEAYRSASAAAALEGRDRTLVKVRAAGAIVVDAPPGELATEVVDRYIELKTTGRL